EIRFGARARTNTPGTPDRGSTLALSLAAAVPSLGFLIAMKARTPTLLSRLPAWLGGPGAMPGMPAIAWVGVGLAGLGLLMRLWAVLTLREGYPPALLVHEGHPIGRG